MNKQIEYVQVRMPIKFNVFAGKSTFTEENSGYVLVGMMLKIGFLWL